MPKCPNSLSNPRLVSEGHSPALLFITALPWFLPLYMTGFCAQ